MSNIVFSAARTTQKMVNRDKELQDLKDAFCLPGKDTRVVIIEGAGGLGKTRLLSEALWRAGQSAIFPSRDIEDPENEWNIWDIRGSVIVSEQLDFSEVNLHTSENFFQRIRRGLTRNEEAVVEFPNYDAAVDNYRHQLSMQSNYRAVQQAAEAARQAFLTDHKRLANRYRIVWALDTAELLGYPDAQWLLEQGLLSDSDLTFSTQQRLLDVLENGELINTTIVLVGRPEAREYFDKIIEAGKADDAKFSVKEIKLDVFSVEEVVSYVNYLSDEYSQHPTADPDIATYLNDIATDKDRINVLHLYTGGQPVSLALFVDALAEGNYEPEALQDTFDETKQRLDWDKTANEPNLEKLEIAQFQIEEEFIRLIFSQKTDLRSRILTALVRARRGLDLDRLVHILSQGPDFPSQSSTDEIELRQKIEKELDQENRDSIRWLSFVKERGDGKLILQDELYRIYDRHMAFKVANVPDGGLQIVEDKVSIEDETRDRVRLYRQMQDFIEENLAELRVLRSDQRVEDLEKLFFRSAAQALSEQPDFVGDIGDIRDNLVERILESELERMHYLLRIDPDAAFNDQYADLAEQMWRAFDEESDVQVRLELWRFLNDENAQKFVRVKDRESKVKETTPLKTLKRAAIQASIADWIKLFWVRGDYSRAVKFAEDVENIIDNLPTGSDLWITLTHTFSYEERRHWRVYAQIYLGEDIQRAITVLEEHTVKDLARLLTTTGMPEKGEKGFQSHPGKVRLQRLIGITFNTIGYGYAVQGYYRKASETYAMSLRYLQDTGFQTQEAVVRNNLSRALSEMGLITRSLRICEDGLSLKKEIGWEIQIAVSYSTLALIYNNALQPENAWIEAAKAVAYFRKLDNERGLGLALFHLAEALRRLAVSNKPKQDTPEALFETARVAINESVQIFSGNPESYRYIECLIEQGSLYRDYMNVVMGREQELESRVLSISALGKGLKRFNKFGFHLRRIDTLVEQADNCYNTGELDNSRKVLQKAMALVGENAHKTASRSLTNALNQAREMNLPRHQLDASVDLAYTYYYASEFGEVEKLIDNAVALVPDSALLETNKKLPNPTDAEPYVFMLLAKIHTLKGELRMDQFIARAEEVCKDIAVDDKQQRRCVVHDDDLATQRLKEAAEAYVLAMAYSNLFSTRAPIFTVVMNSLYGYLRKFNETEMKDFYRYQQEAGETYNIKDIEPEKMTDLEVFLKQSFGDYLKQPSGFAEGS